MDLYRWKTIENFHFADWKSNEQPTLCAEDLTGCSISPSSLWPFSILPKNKNEEPENKLAELLIETHIKRVNKHASPNCHESLAWPAIIVSTKNKKQYITYFLDANSNEDIWHTKAFTHFMAQMRKPYIDMLQTY